MVVADASAIIQICLSEADIAALAAYELIAPPLLWSEANSVIHELQWRRQITAELASRAYEKLASLPVRTRQPAALHATARQIADRLGWAKTYDAEYVALAQIARVRLLTVDARLAGSIRSLVDVVGPTELEKPSAG